MRQWITAGMPFTQMVVLVPIPATLLHATALFPLRKQTDVASKRRSGDVSAVLSSQSALAIGKR